MSGYGVVIILKLSFLSTYRLDSSPTHRLFGDPRYSLLMQVRVAARFRKAFEDNLVRVRILHLLRSGLSALSKLF